MFYSHIICMFPFLLFLTFLPCLIILAGLLSTQQGRRWPDTFRPREKEKNASLLTPLVPHPLPSVQTPPPVVEKPQLLAATAVAANICHTSRRQSWTVALSDSGGGNISMLFYSPPSCCILWKTTPLLIAIQLAFFLSSLIFITHPTLPLLCFVLFIFLFSFAIPLLCGFYDHPQR